MDRQRRTILLVDDDEDDCFIIRDLLSDIAGVKYELSWEDTYAGALEAIGRSEFDACLVDYRLGERTGLELIAEARRQGFIAPMIILTGQGDQEVDLAAMKAGAADYLTKGQISADLLDRSIRYAVKRAQTLAELHESKQFFQDTLDSLMAQIAILDHSGQIVSVNSSWHQLDADNPLVGKNCDIGKNYLDTCHAFESATEGEPEITQGIRGVIEKTRDSFYAEYFLGEGQSRKWFILRVTRFLTESTTRVVVAHENITELKRAEEALRNSREELRQSQKMEAIGKLAGGVAHDFNNLLTSISGHAELLSQQLGEENPLQRFVRQILEGSDKAAGLTRQLLAFSRKQMLQPEILNLNLVVDDYNKMLRRLIGEDIELSIKKADALGNVKLDPSQIGQVIVNLAVNARDAMPNGGKLIIETDNVVLDEAYARRHTGVIPGPYVMLAVSDDGCGIEEDVQSRIFEPFFSTKKGKGTGLGLSTVYGIVKQSSGNIWVYSEPGHGTIFKTYFPWRQEEVEAKKSTGGASENLKGTEIILVVEDKDEVRNLIKEVLLKKGYSVLWARDGQHALGVAEEHDGPIDLLLSDVIMPRMSGRELADRLTAVRHETKVLYMSGYTSNAIVHHGVVDSDTAFLQKPFTIKNLCMKVRDVLGACPETTVQ